MRKHLSILLLATLAQAIPLHKGETWTWKMTNVPALDSSFGTLPSTRTISATVLDSVPADSTFSLWQDPKGKNAVYWRLLAKDSASGFQDTARILALEDGTQTWDSLSTLLTWEPISREQASLDLDPNFRKRGCPPPKAKFASFFQPPASLLQWHYPWGGAIIDQWHDFQGTNSQWFADSSGVGFSATNPIFNKPIGTVHPLPIGVWTQDGVSRYQVGTQVWYLTRHNGASPTTSLDSLILPAEGMTWTYFDTSFSSTYVSPSQPGSSIVKAQILERPADSVGWARIGLKLTSESMFSRTYDCRIQRDLPRTFVGCPDWAASWERSWYAKGSDGLLSLSIPGCFVRFRMDGIEDSMLNVSYIAGSSPHGFRYSLHQRTLLSVNGMIIRSTHAFPDPIPKSYIKPTAISLLLKRFPAQAITWHDLAGHTGTLRAGDLLKPSATPRLLILDATFPDDSRWQGKYLTGTQH